MLFIERPNRKDNIAPAILKRPIKLCLRLFRKAMFSKAQWEKKLDETKVKDIKLIDKRDNSLNKLSVINEKIMNQATKIIKEGDYTFPKLLHAAINVKTALPPLFAKVMLCRK